MNTRPNFFIPLIFNLKPEDLYRRIKSYISNQIKARHTLTDRRIFRLVLEHNGTIKVPGQYIVEVGKPSHEKGEAIIAIFETDGWYILCTKSRGALKDCPTWVPKDDVTEVVEFRG